ncbi:hypothetical protein FSARC_11643 [Fusarium sarcochroum]|uniref:Uncharacterized protein n=1 Tax=Fusarium sarcochroum TaxID=1208366 RepID=A0A8H4TE89_9HYPO|nr:hypothetical protein FSARC_11643 [Fusarium sarcochroum]
MRFNRLISIVGVHCGGEMGDVIVGGVLDVPGKTMYDKLVHFFTKADELRLLLLNEPRGRPQRNINLLLPACDPRADVGLLIMESDEYAHMSGSNTICTVTALLETGMIPMKEPQSTVALDTAAGLVTAVADCKDGKCTAVAFDNIPSFCSGLDLEVDVPGLGKFKYDVAWGGMWYALVDVKQTGLAIKPENTQKLVETGEKIKKGVQATYTPIHPENSGIRGVTVIAFTEPLTTHTGGKRAVNTVVVSPGRVDRSPCGSLHDDRNSVHKRQRKQKPCVQDNTSARIALPNTTARNVEDALSSLGYKPANIDEHTEHVIATLSSDVLNAQPVNSERIPSGSVDKTSYTTDENEQIHLPVHQRPGYFLDSLGNMDNLLDWPDLLTLDYSFSDLSSLGLESTFDDVSTAQSTRPSTLPRFVSPCPDESRSLYQKQGPPDDARQGGICMSNDSTLFAPQDPMTFELGQGDTQMLLKHIKDQCFPQLWSSPLGKKSPLETHLVAAVLTFANMTYLAPQRISHASLTNLVALLAISSKHLATQLCDEQPQKSKYWNQYAESSCNRAKKHLDYSLRTEISPKVAKYKDLIMAVSTMVSFSILYDRQSDARKYLIDAERLLLTQGLPKSHISRKTRLLHHTYTWNRVVSESTYVLRDFENANVPVIAHPFGQSNDGDPVTRRTGDGIADRPAMPNVNLDDFLHLEPHHVESDSSSRESGSEKLHDIHLKQGRGISESTFMMLYGVSETWLSLVSQTTQLANWIEASEYGSKEKDLRRHEHVERQKESLEHRICSFASPTPTTGLSADLDYLSNASSQEGRLTARSHLVRALNLALVIFFYRRIHNVHPHILQDYVSNVIHALQEFESRCEREKQGGPGSPWPAFMAGCEAVAKENRDYFVNCHQHILRPRLSQMGLPLDLGTTSSKAFTESFTSQQMSFGADPTIITPLVNSVKDILRAAAAEPTVKRFVFTSSDRVITSGINNKEVTLYSSMWNETAINKARRPPPYEADRTWDVYAALKTETEQAVW